MPRYLLFQVHCYQIIASLANILACLSTTDVFTDTPEVYNIEISALRQAGWEEKFEAMDVQMMVISIWEATQALFT